MRVTWVSRAGGRGINSDAVRKLSLGGITCVAAADGLGGGNAGAAASKTAADAVMEAFKASPELSAEALRGYITYAHEKVFRYSASDPEYVGMSSTAAVLLVKGRRAVWANVGDSRIYRFRRGRIAEVTEDNSLAFRAFMDGAIEYNDIRSSAERNKLTDALGAYIKDLAVSDIRVTDSETDFLVCTDGLWEYVTENKMEELYRASRNPREWLEKMLSEREARAGEDGDCFTAAVVSMS